MKKYIMKKLLLASFLSALFFTSVTSSVVLAQAVGDTAPTSQTGDSPLASAVCYDLQNNLYKTNVASYYNSDGATNGEVTKLQQFLQDEGFLIPNPTGYFGAKTLVAVKRYQSSIGILASGYVGPITRAKIKAQSCGVSLGAGNTPSAPYIASAAINITTGNLVLSGSSLNLSGNTIVVDSSISIPLSSTSGGGSASQLIFSVAAYGITSGTHYVQIVNSQTGNSNSVAFSPVAAGASSCLATQTYTPSGCVLQNQTGNPTANIILTTSENANGYKSQSSFLDIYNTELIHIDWSSTNADAWESSYSASGCSDSSLNTSNSTWVANSTSGSNLSYAAKFGGCTLIFKYTAKNTNSGKQATNFVRVYVYPEGYLEPVDGDNHLQYISEITLSRTTNADQSQTLSWSTINATKIAYACIGSNGDIKFDNNLPTKQNPTTTAWSTLHANGWSGTYNCKYVPYGYVGGVLFEDTFTVSPTAPVIGSPAARAPVITSITSAAPGAVFTINGSNFGENGTQVFFDGVLAFSGNFQSGTITTAMPEMIASSGNAAACPTDYNNCSSVLLLPGTHTVTVKNSFGISNAISVTVNQPVNPHAALPTATLLTNGQSSLTVDPSSSITHVWSSTNADTWESYYKASGCTNPAMNTTSKYWVATSTNGSSAGNISAYAGCTVNIEYIAKNKATGGSATAAVTIVVNQNSTTNNNVGTVTTGRPASITLVSPTPVSPGQTISVYGTGLSQSSTLYLNNRATYSFASSNDSFMTFVLPSKIATDQNCATTGCSQSDIVTGLYNVSIRNVYGVSNSFPINVMANNSGNIPTFSISRTMNADQSQTLSWSTTNATKLSYVCTDQNGFTRSDPNLPLQLTTTNTSWDILHASGWSGTYNCVYTVTGDGGLVTANETFTISPTNSQTSNQTPRATLTTNGQTFLTVGYAATINHVWSSTNANAWESSYSAYGCSNPAINVSNASWVANSAQGTDSGNAIAFAGCTVTLTYTAKNTNSGKQATASVVIYVNQKPLNNIIADSNSYPKVLGAFTSSCTDLSLNMHRGAESSSVIKLQNFLQIKGLLKDKATGFFGDKTVEAVKSYQESKGLSQTGMVYGATRLAIKTDSCQ